MPKNSTKDIIRTRLIKQRREYPLLERQLATETIIKHILALPIFQSAKNIALYHAFRGEVDLEALWHLASQSGKKTYFPVIASDKKNKSMTFLERSPETILRNNHFQIKEPIGTQSIDTHLLDCLFIPLVAFDTQGYRLGMGQGYYDRALITLPSGKKPIYIGVAYNFQKINLLPHDPWDIPLDLVVTERYIYSF